MSLLPVLLITLSLSPAPARAAAITVVDDVKLQHCNDGDTCTFRAGSRKIKVRFFGIDAPEKDQAYGRAARDQMTAWIQAAKSVSLKCHDRSYDRQVCEVLADGVDLSEKAVRQGLAWEYKRFTGGKFSGAESAARTAHLGLWGATSGADAPVRPDCFRRPGKRGCGK
jgi:micrococcal nuclease